jgi:hypothetical protein
VPLGVALTAGHGTNRQHSPTLALFEIRGSTCSWPEISHTIGSRRAGCKANLAILQQALRLIGRQYA